MRFAEGFANCAAGSEGMVFDYIVDGESVEVCAKVIADGCVQMADGEDCAGAASMAAQRWWPADRSPARSAMECASTAKRS